jgi:hypothetical protein
MKVFYLIFLTLLGLSSCKRHKEHISIWIENNSDLNSYMEFSTYIDDSLVDKRKINKDSIADNIQPFGVEFTPGKYKILIFRFVSSIRGESVRCVVNIDSISKSSLLHVNYVYRVLRKNPLVDQPDLQKDKLLRKDFYCELINKNRN